MQRRYKKQKPSRELQTLFNLEWRRAKKLLTPALDATQKPELYVANVLRQGWLGIHFKRNGWFKTSHVITLSASHVVEGGDDLVNTIRHEICHCVQQNHSGRFRSLLSELMR